MARFGQTPFERAVAVRPGRTRPILWLRNAALGRMGKGHARLRLSFPLQNHSTSLLPRCLRPSKTSGPALRAGHLFSETTSPSGGGAFQQGCENTPPPEGEG